MKLPLSIVRLLSLLAIVWFIVLAVKQEHPVFYACSGAMLILFLFLVKRYNFQKDLRNLNIRIRDLNQKELSCLKHQFREYPDGREFADPRHPWSHDLDLLGRGSLYQYLNRTSTIKGRALLAEALTTEPGGPGVDCSATRTYHRFKGADRFQASLYRKRRNV